MSATLVSIRLPALIELRFAASRSVLLMLPLGQSIGYRDIRVLSLVVRTTQGTRVNVSVYARGGV